MLFRQITLFAAFAAAGCSGKKAEHHDDAALRVPAIRLLDADGDTAAEVHVEDARAGECRWLDRDDEGVVTRDGATTVMRVSSTTIATLAPGPAGRVLRDHDGADVARVVVEGPSGRISALDGQGIALFRIRADGAAATLLDRGGRPLAAVAQRDDLLVVKARDDAITHYVTGTRDGGLAALLAAPALELRHRLLLACDRLLGTNHDS